MLRILANSMELQKVNEEGVILFFVGTSYFEKSMATSVKNLVF